MYQNGQYDFDLAMWDWFPAADPDFILSVLTCDEWGNWSDAGYCNHDYDKLYDRAEDGDRPAGPSVRSSSRCRRSPSTTGPTSS